MAFMTKKSKIQAWLNGLYTENRYGQRMTSGHVHAGRRPGIPAPVIIKRNPILHRRNEQYSAVGISLVNQNQAYKHMIRVRVCLLYDVPAAVFPSKIKDLWMGDPSAIQIAATSWNNLQNLLLWNVSFLEHGQCVSQNLILPKYHFAKVALCQKIILPK